MSLCIDSWCFCVDPRRCEVSLKNWGHDRGMALDWYACYVSSSRLLKAPEPASMETNKNTAGI